MQSKPRRVWTDRRSMLSALATENPGLLRDPDAAREALTAAGFVVGPKGIRRDIAFLNDIRREERHEQELSLISLAMSRRYSIAETQRLLARAEPDPISMDRVTIWRRKKEILALRRAAIADPEDLVASELTDLETMEREAAQEAGRADDGQARRAWMDTRLKVKARKHSILGLDVRDPTVTVNVGGGLSAADRDALLSELRQLEGLPPLPDSDDTDPDDDE